MELNGSKCEAMQRYSQNIDRSFKCSFSIFLRRPKTLGSGWLLQTSENFEVFFLPNLPCYGAKQVTHSLTFVVSKESNNCKVIVLPGCIV